MFEWRSRVPGLKMRPTPPLLLVLSLLLAMLLFSSANALAPSASTTDNLNGVALVSGSEGWAVGAAGTIQHFPRFLLDFDRVGNNLRPFLGLLRSTLKS